MGNKKNMGTGSTLTARLTRDRLCGGKHTDIHKETRKNAPQASGAQLLQTHTTPAQEHLKQGTRRQLV
jgi:hypothetical protein